MNADTFRSLVEEISKNGREQGVEDSELVDAWNEAYTSMNVVGAYFLEEDGYSRGDASDTDILIDSRDRKLIAEDMFDFSEEIEEKLLDTLCEEFIEIYREYVYDAIVKEEVV
jgi:hypothetical protein